MPDLSVPEVRLKDRLPEGLRDMSIDDIQKALPDVRLPRFDRRDAAKAAQKSAGKAAGRAAKRAEQTARDLEKVAAKQAEKAAKQAEKAAKAVDGMLPRRAGPNPVPIAIFAMLGGLVVGWILATNPATGPRVSRLLDTARTRFREWRGRGNLEDEAWDTSGPRVDPLPLRADVEPERFPEMTREGEMGVGVGPGHLPTAMGATEPAGVGADGGTISASQDRMTGSAHEPSMARADERAREDEQQL